MQSRYQFREITKSGVPQMFSMILKRMEWMDLKEQDDRWNDSEPALYLHNFVTRVEAPGAGSTFLRFAEEYALKKGKKYLRLDSAADNPSLARYYTSQGFVPAGTCTEGGYNGILRQKELLP